MRCPNSSAIKWKWGEVQSSLEEVYQGQIRIMDIASIEVMQQAMCDSRVFAVCQGNARDRLFQEMRKGVETSSLVCGWHKSPAYITIILQCPHCRWMAGAEIYTRAHANTGVTQADYYNVQQVLSSMLGVEIGPNQGV